MRFTSSLAIAALVTGELLCQGFDARPRIERARLAAGNFLDLDAGLILREKTQRRAVADLGFDRDGKGFVVFAPQGCLAAADGAEHPEPEAEWTKEPARLKTDGTVTRGRWFVRTNRMTIARVEVVIVQPYATPSALISWVRAPETKPVFAAPPKGLDASWKGNTIRLRWEAPPTEKGKKPDRFLVEHEPPKGKPKLEVVAKPEHAIQVSAADGLHRVHVRRILADDTVGLPSSMTLRARRAPLRRFRIDLPRDWHRHNGGLDLQQGSARVDSPDIVLYAYGVYSPRGGLQKVGSGREAYRTLSELPATGYVPVYGRIDHGDVLAVRLADGRFAKLWIEQTGTHTLHETSVHGAFLASGRRRFPARPTSVDAKLKGTDLIEMAWQAAPGATRYEIRVPGAEKALTVTKNTRAVVGPLQPNRYHELELVAIEASGDKADPVRVGAPTFGDGYVYGRFTLANMGARGYSFVDRRSVAADDAKLELLITNSAGGASALTFRTPFGAAPCEGAEFGAFPSDESRSFVKTVNTDSDRPKSETFWVRTRDGSLACVRIRGREYPRIHIEYVWRKKKQ